MAAAAPVTDSKARPTRPDEEAFKVELAQAEKEHAAVQEKLTQIKAQIDNARSNNPDSPAAKRQQELRAELASIRQKQSKFKSSRTSVQEKISGLDATLKARIAEQNNSRARMSFKSVEELDREIDRLEKQVDSGTLRLVDEKKALADISSLRKQRKTFGALSEAQSSINELKTQISELKKSLDNPESKALSDRYTEIQKELDGIKAEHDEAFKNLNALRDERSKLQAEVQEKFTAIREIKDKYYKGRKAYKEYEDELWKQRRERQKAQREAFERERRKKIADKKLEEASRPAYTDEILIAQGLIRHFDPSYDFASLGLDDKKAEAGALRAEVGRTVDASDIKGVRIVKKEDRDDDYFVGTGGKKGKKGKKVNAANATPGAGTPAETAKFNLSFGVIEDFAKVKVDPPMNQSDVPAVVEKLAAKITQWKKDQAAKTDENIKKAKEEIVRLEEEETAAAAAPTGSEKTDARSTDAAKKPAQENGINGSVEAEFKQETDAVADATKELQKASIEDQA